MVWVPAARWRPPSSRPPACSSPRYAWAKVDTEAQQALAARFSIRSIPTLALFRGGREIARQAGAMGAADIVRWVKGHTG
jgi:thioredoxin 2